MGFKQKPKNTLIYVHIPKTGGETFENILRRIYGCSRHTASQFFGFDEQLTFQDRVNQLKEKDAPFKKKLRVLYGHAGFGTHELLSQNVDYVTFLRFPVELVVSFYYHHLRHFPQRLQNARTGKINTLQEILAGEVPPKQRLLADNIQTRFLAAQGGVLPEVEYGQCTKAMYEKAKENLEKHFSVVGITEKYDASLLMMKRKLGWAYPFYYKKNVNTHRPGLHELSTATRDIIFKHNTYDLDLYNYARYALDLSIEEEGGSFPRELKYFKSLNHYMGKVNRFSDNIKTKVYKIKQR